MCYCPVRGAARGGAAERGRLVRHGAPVPRRPRARAARQLLALRRHRAREGQRQRAVSLSATLRTCLTLNGLHQDLLLCGRSGNTVHEHKRLGHGKHSYDPYKSMSFSGSEPATAISNCCDRMLTRRLMSLSTHLGERWV